MSSSQKPHSFESGRRAPRRHNGAATLFQEMSHAARHEGDGSTGAAARTLPAASSSTRGRHMHTRRPGGSSVGGRAPATIPTASAEGLRETPTPVGVTSSTAPSSVPSPGDEPFSGSTAYFYVHPLRAQPTRMGRFSHPLPEEGRAAGAVHPWSGWAASMAPPPRRESPPCPVIAQGEGGVRASSDGDLNAEHVNPNSLPITSPLHVGSGTNAATGLSERLSTPPKGLPSSIHPGGIASLFALHGRPTAVPAVAGVSWLQRHRPSVHANSTFCGSPCGGRRSSMATSATSANTPSGQPDRSSPRCTGAPQPVGFRGGGLMPFPPHPAPSMALRDPPHIVGVSEEEMAKRCWSQSCAGKEGGGLSSVSGPLRSPSPPLALSSSAAVRAPLPLSLVPPFRFARVEAGVYRGAYPVLRNFPFLSRLRLRTIVSLIPEPPTYDLECFAAAEHIQLHHIHAERSKGEVQLLPSALSEALQLLINKDSHPVFIHCLDGRHVAGLVVMALRKLLQWSTSAAHTEYVRFTREVQDEEAFIGEYTGPLEIPLHLPSWLWGGCLQDAVTGQQKRLPSTMRWRFAAPMATGTGAGHPHPPQAATVDASVENGGPSHGTSLMGERNESPLGALDVTVRHSAKPLSQRLNDRLRQPPTAPWLQLPLVETVVETDGQRYVDMDHLLQSVLPLHGSGVSSALSGTLVPGAGGATPPSSMVHAPSRGSALASRSTSASSSVAASPAAAGLTVGLVRGGSTQRGRTALSVEFAALAPSPPQQSQQQAFFSHVDTAVGVAGAQMDCDAGALLWTSGLVPRSRLRNSSGIPSGSGDGSNAVGGGSRVGVGGLTTADSAGGGALSGVGTLVLSQNGVSGASSSAPLPLRAVKRSYSR